MRGCERRALIPFELPLTGSARRTAAAQQIHAHPTEVRAHGHASTASRQVLSLGDDGEDEEGDAGADDPFMQALLDFETGGSYAPVQADAPMLLALRKEDVFACRWPGQAPTTWWRNMVPEIPIAQCGACNHFFHQEEWEFAVLAKGACPFCRAPQQDE